MDILLLNFDRSELNWGILEKKGNRDLYIFDNEYSFTIGSCYISCRKQKEYECIKINRDYDELVEFLKIASQEELDLLRNMYDTLTPAYIESVIESVEKYIGREIDCKKTILHVYKLHYGELKGLIKQPTYKMNYIQ